MSDAFKEMNDKLEAQVSDLQAQLAAANDKLAKAGVEKLEQQIEDLQTQVASLSEKSQADEAKITETQATIDSLTKELDEVKAANAELETTIEEVRAAELVAKRVALLVDGGIDKEAAEAHVETFSNLDDTQFEVIAKTLVSAAKKPDDEDEEDGKNGKGKGSEDSEASDDDDVETDEAEANADEKSLDEVKASEEGTVNADASQDEVDEISETRAELRKGLASLLGREEAED